MIKAPTKPIKFFDKSLYRMIQVQKLRAEIDRQKQEFKK